MRNSSQMMLSYMSWSQHVLHVSKNCRPRLCFWRNRADDRSRMPLGGGNLMKATLGGLLHRPGSWRVVEDMAQPL